MKVTKEFSKMAGPREMYGAVTIELDSSAKEMVSFNDKLGDPTKNSVIKENIVKGISEAVDAASIDIKSVGGFRVVEIGASPNVLANVAVAYKYAAFQAAEELISLAL